MKVGSTVEVYSISPITSPSSSRPIRVGLILGLYFTAALPALISGLLKAFPSYAYEHYGDPALW